MLSSLSFDRSGSALGVIVIAAANQCELQGANANCEIVIKTSFSIAKF